MNYSPAYYKILKAISEGYRHISQVGSSRSGKTYSNLQVIDFLSQISGKPLVSTCAGMTFGNLKDGAISDYENILNAKNIDVSKIRRQNPFEYKRNKSTFKFFAFDKPSKAHGPQRDILQLNEANIMPWGTVHQLIQRTGMIVLYDYNPSNEFWIESEGINKRDDFIEIHTTFLDNIQNLSASQISEFEIAKQKAEYENANGIKGYWSNWWNVYGLGLKGDIEGIVYTNWQPCTVEYYNSLDAVEFVGIDWGFNDPLAICGVKFDKVSNQFYFHEYLYKSGVQINDYDKILQSLGFNPFDKKVFICDSAEPSKIDYLKNFGYNAFPVNKPNILERVQFLQACKCFYTDKSINLQKERSNYVCDKYGVFSGDDHILDSVGYASFTMRNAYTINPLKF